MNPFLLIRFCRQQQKKPRPRHRHLHASVMVRSRWNMISNPFGNALRNFWVRYTLCLHLPVLGSIPGSCKPRGKHSTTELHPSLAGWTFYVFLIEGSLLLPTFSWLLVVVVGWNGKINLKRAPGEVSFEMWISEVKLKLPSLCLFPMQGELIRVKADTSTGPGVRVTCDWAPIPVTSTCY